jgi:hypothetical protein
MKINRSVLLLLTCLAVLTATASTQERAKQANSGLPYRNPGLSIEDRVADLLSRMTLEEKIDQICGGGRGNVSVRQRALHFRAGGIRTWRFRRSGRQFCAMQFNDTFARRLD